MKRIILTSVALALAVLTVSAKPNKKDENKVIDKLKYTITYRTKSVRDTTKTDSEGRYNYENDDMQLLIGDKVSYFYSATYRAYEEELRKSVDANNIAIPTSTSARGSISMDFYRNYPTGKSTYLDKVIREKFRIIEPLEQPQWDIIADSTKQILDYHCQMARCSFKGRTWTAWFTTDIPLDNGPWKLCGLPGLILRAYDNSRHYIFDCVGLKQTDGTRNIVFDDCFNSYAATSMSNLQRLKANTTPMDIMNRSGKDVTFKVVSSSVNGKLTEAQQESMRKQMQKRQPQNPIERL